MKVEVGKIITLGNDERYLVVMAVVHNNNNYYYIAECNDNLDDIKDNYKIVKETNTNGVLFIDEVVGESNLKAVLPVFVNEIVNK